MLYRICNQLVILVRFRHLNGNLKLAGSGNGIDLWGVSWWHTTLAVSGRWGWFTGMCHEGTRLDWGDRIDLWGRAMGTHVTGWIGAMGLNHGDMWHWLDRGDGIVSWGHATLAGAGQWGWFMAVCGTSWNGVMGLIQGLAMGAHDTGWIRVMGLIYGVHHGGTWLDRGDGIDLRGHAIRVWHWLGHVMGARLDQRDGIDLWGHIMGVRHWLDVNDEIDLWGYSMRARNWIRGMELICGGEPWGRMTLARSGWGDWFMWARHDGARHWLDWGYGIDSWGRVEWQSTIWLLNVNDETMCLNYGWRWGKCAECVWLRAW